MPQRELPRGLFVCLFVCFSQWATNLLNLILLAVSIIMYKNWIGHVLILIFWLTFMEWPTSGLLLFWTLWVIIIIMEPVYYFSHSLTISPSPFLIFPVPPQTNEAEYSVLEPGMFIVMHTCT